MIRPVIRSREEIVAHSKRLEAARQVMQLDRDVEMEIRAQILALQGERVPNCTPGQAMSIRMVRVWLTGETDVEPAAEWERLVPRWQQIFGRPAPARVAA